MAGDTWTEHVLTDGTAAATLEVAPTPGCVASEPLIASLLFALAERREPRSPERYRRKPEENLLVLGIVAALPAEAHAPSVPPLRDVGFVLQNLTDREREQMGNELFRVGVTVCQTGDLPLLATVLASWEAAAVESAKRRDRRPDQQETGPRKKEVAWREAQREMLQKRYAGQWVVLEGEEIISHGPDAATVVAEARRQGIHVPYLFKVETDLPPGVSLLGL